MPQNEAGSDGKCFNIRQGVRGCFNIPWAVRGMHQYFLGNDVGLGKNYYYHELRNSENHLFHIVSQISNRFYEL